MKTTVDIPEALYRQAKIRAAEERTTRALLPASLPASLDHRAAVADALPRRERFAVDERGWPVRSVAGS